MIPEPGTPEFRRWALRWPRGLTGHACQIHPRGQSAIVLCFRGADRPQAFAHLTRFALAADDPRSIDNGERTSRTPMKGLHWWSRVPGWRQLASREAVLISLEFAHPGPVLAAIRHGVRLFHVVHSAGSSFSAPAHSTLALVTARSLRKLVARIPGASVITARLIDYRMLPPAITLRTTRHASFEALRWSRRDAAGSPTPVPELRVTHFIGTLGSGGAERQLTHVATHGVRTGQRHRVLTMLSLEGGHAHYRPVLEEAGVVLDSLVPRARRRALPEIRRVGGGALPPSLVAALDRHASTAYLLPTIEKLVADPPDVLHGWLDESGLIGAIAGLVAGVPRILVSTRNVNPSHFPRFHRAWFRDAYRAIALDDRVHFIANSAAGARDYSEWTRVPLSRFSVILNGLDTRELSPLERSDRATRRSELGLHDTDFVLVGVFRLSDEKRPEDFLAVVHEARDRVPGLKAIHIGAGELQDSIQRRAQELGLGDCLRFMGPVEQPAAYLGVADASILTSQTEGCPNVSLEAQALGVPMIVTHAGGSPETVDDGESGFVCEVGDTGAMVAHLEALAADDALRRRMGTRAAHFVRERFDLEGMLERTQALYRPCDRGSD